MNEAEVQGTIMDISPERTIEIGGSPNQRKQLIIRSRDFFARVYFLHINAWNEKIYKLDKYQIGHTIGVRFGVKTVKQKDGLRTVANLIDVIPTDFEEYQRIETSLEKGSNDPLECLNPMEPLTPEGLLSLQLKTLVSSIAEYTKLLVDESRDKWESPSARMRRAFVKFIEDCNIPMEERRKLLRKINS